MLHPNCEKCKLWEGCQTPFMSGSGPDHPIILYVGEGPGQTEDSRGEPFVGKAGKILRDAIEILELDPKIYGFTNAVRCRPPDNRTPTTRELNYCAHFLEDEIRERDPKVVVLLGNSPLKVVLGQNGITNWNGVVVDRDGRTYVPAYHPSFFNYGNMDKMEEWLQALSKAVQAAEGTEFKSKEDKFEIIYPSDEKDFLGLERELLAYDGLVSYDIESKWLEEHRKGNKVLSASLAIDGLAYSFPIDHPDSYVDREWPLRMLRNVLPNVRVIGHNIRFDCKHTRTQLGIEFKPYGDTMRMSQLIVSTPGIHGLKRLAGMHLGMFEYDRELQEYTATHPEANYDKGGDYESVPLDELLPYGAKDAAAVNMLYDILYKKMTELQKKFYYDLIMPVDYALGCMETNGFLLDKSVLERYLRLYTKIRDSKYYAAILTDSAVKRYVKAMQEKKKNFVFNPNSSVQIGEVFFGKAYKGYKVVKETETGKPSVSVDVLGGSPVSKDPMYESYVRWGLLDDMLSKYIEPPLAGKWDAGDGRVRSNYNIGGAKTGRLSSSQPNLQNIPTPEKEAEKRPDVLLVHQPLKNIFTHTWEGGCLLCMDYSSMELRIMANVSNCVKMLETFERDEDPHCLVTRYIYPKIIPPDMPDKEVKKQYRAYRYRAKWTNWTLIFGGDEHTLHSTYGIPLDECKYIVKTYYAEFPEVLDYQQDTIDFAKLNGYVETLFGRRLYLPYINDKEAWKAAKDKRTGINMPIQGTASDLLLCAIVIIHAHMQQNHMKSSMVNTVHDSTVFDVYPGELSKLVILCRDAMENIKSYAPTFFPHMDFRWLTVPLKAEAEVGSHYGGLESYEEI